MAPVAAIISPAADVVGTVQHEALKMISRGGRFQQHEVTGSQHFVQMPAQVV
jgi:hypothetical protein